MGTYVVKIGTSIVAGDDGAVRRERLGELAGEIAALHDEGADPVIVTSGAIACGIRARGLGKRPREMDELQAASAIGQGDLYRVYRDLLGERGVSSAQVLLTFFDLSQRTQYLNARQTLRKLLDWHVVPVINENDTTATDEISFGDNDFLAAQVAILLGASRLIMLTDADGLYESDPRDSHDARMVAEVRDFEEIEHLEIGADASPLGSGGMRSKVVAAEMATAAGIPAVVCSGNRTGALTHAAHGEREGTFFHPQDRRVSSFKLWLKYAKPAHGRLLIDAGAARALRDQGTSLLPVGIVEVEGSFHAGDAVEVVLAGNGGAPGGDATGGGMLGKGISNYSADELRRIKGMNSAQVKDLIPRASEEAVHRDYFVLA